MDDYDRRDIQPADDLQNFIAVRATVDAEPVLNQGNVAEVEQIDALSHRRCGTIDQFTDDVTALGWHAIAHPDHADVHTVGGQTCGEPRAEPGQPAPCRWECTEHPHIQRAETGTLGDGTTNQVQCRRRGQRVSDGRSAAGATGGSFESSVSAPFFDTAGPMSAWLPMARGSVMCVMLVSLVLLRRASRPMHAGRPSVGHGHRATRILDLRKMIRC